MSLRRRPFLAFLSAVVAGCGERRVGEATRGQRDETPASTQSTTNTIPEGPRVAPQSVTLRNTRSDPVFVTVAVERNGESVFVESRQLVPGEQYTAGGVLATAGTYDVVVEAADGTRSGYEWDVVEGLDGLAVTLTDGFDFIRTVRCGPDCAPLRAGETLGEPLVGDGSGRWYAPAEVVLANPGAARTVSLTVALYGETLVDARYRIREETRIVVPLSYRSGRYDVSVETDRERVAGEWLVPQEPTRVVDLSMGTMGCGPANTELRVENADDQSHAVRVAVEREGTVRFEDRFELASGEQRAVVPVDASGRYDVRVRVDGGSEQVGEWWACPPTGPARVLVDGTGEATIRSPDG